MIRDYITRFIGTYGFTTSEDFIRSLCPSFRYNIQGVTIPFSIFTALVSSLMGVGPVVILAMLISVIVETWTGIKASHVRGGHFETFKFSRCIIKLFIWLVIVFIVNSFSNDCAERAGWIYSIGVVFFDFVKMAVLTYFVVEYVASILENLAVIDGKPKEALIYALKDRWSGLMDFLKKKNEK